MWLGKGRPWNAISLPEVVVHAVGAAVGLDVGNLDGERVAGRMVGV